MRVLLAGATGAIWTPVDQWFDTTRARCVWFGAFGEVDAHPD